MATQTAISPAMRSQFGTGTAVSVIKAVEPDKARVPLVGHIITDEDIGALQVLLFLVILNQDKNGIIYSLCPHRFVMTVPSVNLSSTKSKILSSNFTAAVNSFFYDYILQLPQLRYL